MIITIHIHTAFHSLQNTLHYMVFNNWSSFPHLNKSTEQARLGSVLLTALALFSNLTKDNSVQLFIYIHQMS